MKVILDTNIFCADFRFNGGASAVFWNSLSRIGWACLVPEVVQDEVLAVHRRQLEEAAHKLTAAERGWFRLTGQVSGRSRDIAHEALVKEYTRFLKDHLQAHDVALLKYPDVSHRELVERATMRRKPFSESGTGYRDALIWMTLRQLRASNQDEICFVTSNTKDFGVGPELHPDLAAELDGQRIQLFNKLEEFNAEKIIPNLQRLDETLNQLQADTYTAFSLTDWIDYSLHDALNDAQHGCDFVALHPDHGRAWISSLKEKSDLVVDDVRLLPSGDLLVLANVDLVVEVVVSADWEDCDRYADIREFFGGDCSGSPTAYVESDGNVAFTLTLKAQTLGVDSCAIDEVHSESYVDINPHPRRDA